MPSLVIGSKLVYINRAGPDLNLFRCYFAARSCVTVTLIETFFGTPLQLVNCFSWCDFAILKIKLQPDDRNIRQRNINLSVKIA